MHVHMENRIARSDCTIHTLSWMGKVPETLSQSSNSNSTSTTQGGGGEEDGWKLNRLHYYQEGWLATGNSRGIVGATFTAAHCKKNYDSPPRTNFNLRGHRSEVVLVKWNEPYQKLATCDHTGVIFVWIKHEGRWSIELINDRNSQVTDFAWSHDGRMALICYRDGFVLVGSVAGQRYWSSMLNLDAPALITCGCWTPDDQKVLFGTSSGQVLVMSSTGAMLAQVTVQEGQEVGTLAWSVEKFFLGEQDANSTAATPTPGDPAGGKTYTLAVCFRNGSIFLMTNYDDVCPKVLHTGLNGVQVEWSNDGEILAVGGFVRRPNLECHNEIRFYNRDGQLRCRTTIQQQPKPLSALTWGHNDRRLFVAAGSQVYTLWVTKRVPTLQFCCRRSVQRALTSGEDAVMSRLPLPTKLRAAVGALFSPTIKGYIPRPNGVREFVCMPPPSSERLHCTLMKHGGDDSGLFSSPAPHNPSAHHPTLSSTTVPSAAATSPHPTSTMLAPAAATTSAANHYTLYLEYLGGLIPLLRGKRTSKLRPEFVVYDPLSGGGGGGGGGGGKTGRGGSLWKNLDGTSDGSSISDSDEDEDSEGTIIDGGCSGGSPRLHRKRRLRKRRRRQQQEQRRENQQQQYSDVENQEDDRNYIAPRKKSQKLLEVTSNIWGTKFKIHGLAPFLPDDLGSILYKTSLLHLQPRQMTVTILELWPSAILKQHARDPNYNPNQFSESEDENQAPGTSTPSFLRDGLDAPPLISPEAPPPHRLLSIPPQPDRPACLNHILFGQHTPPQPTTNHAIVSSSLGVAVESHGVVEHSHHQNHHPHHQNQHQFQHQHQHQHQHSHHSHPPPTTRRHHLTPLEIRTLDGSPPQRRSPSLKSRSLSPATESAQVAFTQNGEEGIMNTMNTMTNTGGGVGVGVASQGGAVPKVPTLNNVNKVNNQRNCGNSVDAGILTTPTSALNIMQMAAKKLESSGSGTSLIENGFTTTGGNGSGGNVVLTHAQIPRWSCQEIKFIDEDILEDENEAVETTTQGSSEWRDCSSQCNGTSQSCTSQERHIELTAQPQLMETELTTNGQQPQQQPWNTSSNSSTSLTSTVTHHSFNPAAPMPSSSSHHLDTKPRVILSRPSVRPPKAKKHRGDSLSCYKILSGGSRGGGGLDFNGGLDSGDYYGSSSLEELSAVSSASSTPRSSRPTSPTTTCLSGGSVTPPPIRRSTPKKTHVRRGSLDMKRDNRIITLPATEHSQSASLPSSPVHRPSALSTTSGNQRSGVLSHRRLSNIRNSNGRHSVESSDEEVLLSGDEVTTSQNYKNLETFQKAQLSKKLRAVRVHSGGGGEGNSPPLLPRNASPRTQRRHFVLHNKAPLWNENSQVYQLDFGGRVTQESAKNFQIEFRGKQVMQFGRIDTNAYTLDFQYPFSAIQAFAVALANVTQRLK